MGTGKEKAAARLTTELTRTLNIAAPVRPIISRLARGSSAGLSSGIISRVGGSGPSRIPIKASMTSKACHNRGFRSGCGHLRSCTRRLPMQSLSYLMRAKGRYSLQIHDIQLRLPHYGEDPLYRSSLGPLTIVSAQIADVDRHA